MTDLRNEMEKAIAIAEETGQVLLRHFADSSLEVQSKGPRDVVTPADFESEALVLRRLHDAFPDDDVIGEEGTDTAGGKRRRWYVDPLDGTLNFSRGVPVWSVSIALYEGDRGLAGVVHDPIRGETFAAARGLGAFCNGRAIKTTGLIAAEDAFVHVTVDFNDVSRREGLEDIQRLAPAVLRTRNFGSAALGLAYVAAGRLDAMLHRHANAWDYGAGMVLIEEAGGAVSSMHDTPWRPGEMSIAGAATDELRRRLLQLLDQAR
jgi:myo-inositol-1(or 4)-monophosphatase